MIASLLVSVVLLGHKFTALKLLVNLSNRKAELRTALALLQPKLEDENVVEWLDNAHYDAAQRETRIDELALPSGRIYSTMEGEAIEWCLSKIGSSSGDATQPKPKQQATMTRLLSKKQLLLSAERDEPFEIRAAAQEIAAYILGCGGRHLQSLNANANVVHTEILQSVNAHHTIVYSRQKTHSIHDLVFLNSIVAKQVADEPPTYVVAVVPISSHAKISEKREVGAVRAEICRAYRLTQVAPNVTKLEHVHSLEMKARVAAIVRKTTKAQMGDLLSLTRYFQQLRPLSDCTKEDGLVLGHLLMDALENAPADQMHVVSYFARSSLGQRDPAQDRAHAIRTFVMCTAMLRECGFPRIGCMLVALIDCAPHAIGADAPITSEGQLSPRGGAFRFASPGALTQEQAASVGRLLASEMRASPKISTLGAVVQSIGPLREMATRYDWFVPMLEAVVKRQLPLDVVHAQQRSIVHRLMSRLSIAVFPSAGEGVANSFDSLALPVLPVCPLNVARYRKYAARADRR